MAFADINEGVPLYARASLPALKEDSVIKQAVRHIIDNGSFTILTVKGFSGGLLER